MKGPPFFWCSRRFGGVAIDDDDGVGGGKRGEETALLQRLGARGTRGDLQMDLSLCLSLSLSLSHIQPFLGRCP